MPTNITDEMLVLAMAAYRGEGLREQDPNEDSMRAALAAVLDSLRD